MAEEALDLAELHDIDPNSWRRASSDLLAGDIRWFPVRHHSPACALHVRALIESVNPYAVLVEGPRTFNDLIPLLVHEKAEYPLAIFAHTTVGVDGADPERHGSYYPLCDYSPEVVALRTGSKAGARLKFIDADHQLICALQDPTTSGALNHERHLGFSRALDAAATRAGCRDHNDLWDQLFETTTRSLEDFVRSVNAYGLLARSTTPRGSLATDGTLRREQVMATEIATALAERERDGATEPIVVVTGAFHTTALRDQLTGEAPFDAMDELPRNTIDDGKYLIRFSFDRLDALNGYASGMPSPAWYQRLHEMGGDANTTNQAMLLDVLGEIAERLRADGQTATTSTPSMIAALQQAHGLSALRGRSRPGRTDLIDAVTSCFVQGDVATEGLPVVAATRDVLMGDRVGSVPPGTNRPPIADDFDKRCRTLRLPTDTSTPVRVELDIYRTQSHRDKSRFLHGLAYLGVGFGLWAGGPRHGSGTGLIRESWVCQLTPATDVALVEASAYGSTIAEAVAERYVTATSELEAGEASAAAVAAHLTRAAELGVHAAVPRVVTFLRRQAIEDPSFTSVVSALTELQLLWVTRASLEGRRLGPLPELTGVLYRRACFLMEHLDGLADTELDHALDALLRLRDALAAADEVFLDPSLYWDAVRRLGRQRCQAPLAGLSTGLLWSSRQLADDEVVQAVRGRLLGDGDSGDAALYLRGLLLAAREVIWQATGLTDVISQLMKTWDDEEFLNRLPGLRAAFSSLTPRETDRVAQLIGQGSMRIPVVTDLDEAALQANLGLDSEISERLRTDGLSWAGER